MKTNTNQAIINGMSLPISTKNSIEMCNFIRGRSLKSAVSLLNEILVMKRAMPVRRFDKDRGHKRGIGPGRYPLKLCKVFLVLFDSVKSNAEQKGLNTENLIITIAKANKAEQRYRSGRKGRVKMKNTHVYLEVEEKKND